MSNGSSEETQRSANQYVRSAINTFFIGIIILGGIYFWGGNLLSESSKRIQGNEDGVEAVRQGLKDVLNAGENQRRSYEEMRERVVEVEEMLTSILRRTDETRHEIDAVASSKALQNAETIAVTALADECEQALSKMKKLVVVWEVETMPLMTNDRGRQLASDEKMLQSFMLAIAGKFPTVKNSIDWLAEYQEAVDPLQKAEAQGIKNFSTIPETRIFCEAMLTRANEANQRLERRRRAVEVLLVTSSGLDPGQFTLAQSIKKIEDEKSSAFTEELKRVYQQKLQETIDEQAEFVLKAKKERIVAEKQLEAQQERMAAHAANRQTESLSKDDAIAQEEARKKQLEKEFKIEKGEINRLLGTFLSRGKFQPVPNYSLDSPLWQLMDSGPGPVSLGRLASIGALDPTDEGYELLYHVGGDSRNGRPKTGFPNYTTQGVVNPTVLAKVKRASELLNKYGELLVKKRLLAP